MDSSQTKSMSPPSPLVLVETEDGLAAMATLPDLFVTFIASEPKVNPHYEEVKKESEEWMRKHLWKELDEREVKKRCAADFCYFSAVMCPDVGKEEFRTVCDWIYWVFEFDDQFDEGELGKDYGKAMAEVSGMVAVLDDQAEHTTPYGKSGPEGRRFSGFWADDVAKTFEEMESPEGPQQGGEDHVGSVESTPLQKLFRSIWERVRQPSPDSVQQRYIKSNAHFCRSVAELHGEKFDDMVVMENINRYLQVRAQNIGLYPLLALEEYAYGLDLPQEVFENEAIREIQRLVAEMLTLQNDILSYHREHGAGHSQNLISIFRRRLGLSQQESYDKANELLHRCYRQWYVAHSEMPCWGEKVDSQVQQYLKACLDVLKANVRWSFKSQRYFGKDVDRVRETRQVVLIP